MLVKHLTVYSLYVCVSDDNLMVAVWNDWTVQHLNNELTNHVQAL